MATKVVRDIQITFASTPQLWQAAREGECYCPECHPNVGLGRTPIEALAHLIELELDSEEAG